MTFSGKYAKFSIQAGSGIAYVNLPQTLTSGLVVIEFDVKLKASANGYNGVVINAVDPATDYLDRLVGIFTRPTVQYSGNLEFVIYKDANGNTTWYDTGVAGDGSERHIKIEIDLTNKVINVYIDGNKVLDSVGYQGSINSNSNQIAAIELSLGWKDHNTEPLDASIDNITVVNDSTTVYSEDFEDETVGQAPSGWNVDDPGGTGSNPSIVVEQLGNPPPFTLPAGSELSVSVRCTPDGTSFETCTQHVHPTILDFLNKLPNGYEYLLALTPYPNSDARYENPSVVFSDDLNSWNENDVNNPLYPPPPGATQSGGPHNADPHLVWDPINKEIRLYWRYRSDEEGIDEWRFLKSKDGVKWYGPYKTNLPAESKVSVSVLYDPDDGKWKAWLVDYSVSPFAVKYYESSDGITWSEVATCNIPDPGYNGQSWQVWHLTIHKVGDEFWMIAAMNPVGTSDGQAPIHLFLFRSTDGINWSGYDSPILDTADSLANDSLYRVAFFIKNGMLYVIYSYVNTDKTWHIALTSVDVSSLVGTNTTDNVVSEAITGAGYFVISDYPSSVDVQVSQSLSINVKVRNDGSASGSGTVRLVDHEGNVVDAVDVTLDAGAETSVTLSATAPSSPGTYTWKVEVYNKDTGSVDDSKDITLNVSSPAYQYLGDILTALLQILPYLIVLMVFIMLISAFITALR